MTEDDLLRGSCLGFSVRSTVPLRFLRELPASDLIEVEVSTARAEPIIDGEEVLAWRGQDLDVRVVQEGRGPGSRYDVRFPEQSFLVEPALRRISVRRLEADPRGEARLWGLPISILNASRGALPLHAASVDLGGSAVVVAGVSHAGKSTLAAALAARGHRLLAEDASCLQRGVGRWEAWPGASFLRLRPDVVADLGAERTFAGVPSRPLGDGRVELELVEGRGDGAGVPVAAVVLPRAADAPAVEAVPGPEALRDLWAVSHRLPDAAERTRVFGALADLIREVPVLRLGRSLDADGLWGAVDAVEELALASR